jgi:hypothetical protein
MSLCRLPIVSILTVGDLQSAEIIRLVDLIGLGEGNKKPLGRLKNDLKRSVSRTFSAKTRDILKDVEPRLSVCTVASTDMSTSLSFLALQIQLSVHALYIWLTKQCMCSHCCLFSPAGDGERCDDAVHPGDASAGRPGGAAHDRGLRHVRLLPAAALQHGMTVQMQLYALSSPHTNVWSPTCACEVCYSPMLPT